eukprot:GHVU01010153.1.p1 GENE.GHVU01010153.1~~GHVU01010153.1.p1  ORF type:complete len:164 (-),score=4.85 GHVU01010153.1:244-735(-)
MENNSNCVELLRCCQRLDDNGIPFCETVRGVNFTGIGETFRIRGRFDAKDPRAPERIRVLPLRLSSDLLTNGFLGELTHQLPYCGTKGLTDGVRVGLCRSSTPLTLSATARQSRSRAVTFPLWFVAQSLTALLTRTPSHTVNHSIIKEEQLRQGHHLRPDTLI